MDNNFTVIAALFAAIAAIIAPLITSVIQSIKEYKIKRLELSYTEKIKAVQKLTENYNTVLYDDANYWQSANFQKSALDLAVLCNSVETRNLIINLSETIMHDKKRTDKSDKIYNKCIKKLYEEL